MQQEIVSVVVLCALAVGARFRKLERSTFLAPPSNLETRDPPSKVGRSYVRVGRRKLDKVLFFVLGVVKIRESSSLFINSSRTTVSNASFVTLFQAQKTRKPACFFAPSTTLRLASRAPPAEGRAFGCDVGGPAQSTVVEGLVIPTRLDSVQATNFVLTQQVSSKFDKKLRGIVPVNPFSHC